LTPSDETAHKVRRAIYHLLALSLFFTTLPLDVFSGFGVQLISLSKLSQISLQTFRQFYQVGARRDLVTRSREHPTEEGFSILAYPLMLAAQKLSALHLQATGTPLSLEEIANKSTQETLSTNPSWKTRLTQSKWKIPLNQLAALTLIRSASSNPHSIWSTGAERVLMCWFNEKDNQVKSANVALIREMVRTWEASPTSQAGFSLYEVRLQCNPNAPLTNPVENNALLEGGFLGRIELLAEKIATSTPNWLPC